jgi:hypothetical protein
MSDHTDATELALFLRGELEEPRLASLEIHVSSCDACAARLTGEARLELALNELGPELAQSLAQRRVRARLVGVALIAAAAAVAVVSLGRSDVPAPPASARSISRVVCAEGPDQAACVERAHHHGLFVEYPGWAGAPPFGGSVVERGSAARTDGEDRSDPVTRAAPAALAVPAGRGGPVLGPSSSPFTPHSWL